MIGKIIPWNVRGINWTKRLIIKGCLSKWKPEVVCLQESKMDSCWGEIIKSMWRTKEVGWHYILAVSTAGGIIVMWKEDCQECVEVVKGETTLSCLFKSRKGNMTWAFSGVYCRGNSQERELLGKELEVCRRK